MEIVSRSLAETEEFARDFLASLAVGAKINRDATVVGLVGDLGAGKTTFTQAAARALGIRVRVTSPTFVIMKTYQWQGLPLSRVKGNPWVYPWRRLVHIDCYRLGRADDLLHLGWDELAADRKNLIMVEWPERVGDLLLSPTLKIKFEVVGESERKICYIQ